MSLGNNTSGFVRSAAAATLPLGREGGPGTDEAFDGKMRDTSCRISLADLGEDWFREKDGFVLVRSQSAQRRKRFFDILFAALLLAALLPLLLLLALCVRLESRGPVFYLQTRTGWNLRPFQMIKFRSMRPDAERDGARWTTENDPRITRVGRFLRLTRLDELPQLLNVLRGEMSLIGPRPERPEFDATLGREIPFYAERYSVLPGLSGWAQVMFTYGASVDDAREKLSYDLYYIRNYSPRLDAAILFRTFRVIFTGKGR